MRIYLIRHGDPDYANDTLTPRGHEEAQALAAYLADQHIRMLFCSPLGRARDTARHVARALGMEPVVEDWTREMQGCALPGTDWVHWNIPGEQVRQPAYMDNTADWRAIPAFDGMPLDEQVNGITRHSDLFLARLGYAREGGIYHITPTATDASGRNRIALVCHGGFGVTWLAHLLAIPVPLMWTGFFLRTTSVTTILFEERTPGIAVPRCIGLGEMAHLHRRGIEPGNSGFTANTE